MGDGAIALSYQDALERQLYPQTPEREHKSPLTYEWAFTLAELYRKQQTGEDDTLLRHPKLFEYAQIMSERMRAVDDIDELQIAEANGSLPKLYRMARESYYAHSGMHDMEFRYDRLQKFGAIFAKKLDNKIIENDELLEPTAHDKRIQASILEELGSHRSLSPDNDYSNQALSLNKEIVEDDTIPLFLPYKVHALFSRYDIAWRQTISQYYGFSGSNILRASHEAGSAVQRDFYKDMERCGQYLVQMLEESDSFNQTSNSGRAAMMIGTLSEIAVLGELRDYLLGQDLQTMLEARKAHVREDNSVIVSDAEGRHSDITAPNLSFDIVLHNPLGSGPLSRLNVEVKKGKEMGSYLSETYRLRLGDASKTKLFGKKLIRLAQAKQTKYRGESLGPKQQKIIKDFHSRVNPEAIVEHFASTRA